MADGFRLGQAIHDLLVRKDVTAGALRLGPETAHRWQAVKAFMDEGERIHAPYVQGLVEAMGGTENMPPGIAAVFDAAANPTQAFEWLLELIVLGVGIFSAAGDLLTPAMQDLVNKTWEQNLDMPVSVQDLALAELRGFITHDHALKLARETGFSPDKYDLIFNDTGEPPSIQELLYLRRRGVIDDAALEHGIRQSRVRDEWINAIFGLMFVPPSGGEAVSAAVQGHLTDDQARDVLSANGIDPRAYDWLYATAGRPPGTEQMLELLNRGEVTEDEVVASIRESDVKNKYIPAILAMRRHLMPERTVVSAITKGVFTRDQGIEHLRLLGFNDADAQALASEASSTKTEHHKTASESNVIRAYRDGLVDRGTAHARLVALTYDDTEADFLLDLADTERQAALTQQAVNTVRARMVAHHIDRGAASTALDALHVAGPIRDQLLDLWTEQANENTRMLTPAVLVKGAKGGTVTPQFAHDYLVRLGYSDADASLFLTIEGVAATAGA